MQTTLKRLSYLIQIFLAALALVAFFALGSIAYAGTPTATTYTPDDLFIGFHSSAKDTDVLVKIGQASTFNSTKDLSLGSIALDLASALGSGWATDPNVSWGVIGTTHLTAVGSDPIHTIYASKQGSASTTTPWNTGTLSSSDSRIDSMASAYKNKTSTANSTVAIVQSGIGTAANNAYASYQPGGANATSNAANMSFAFFSPTIEASSANGITDSTATLALFRLTPGSASTPGTAVGTFSINTSGTVHFTVAAPPSTTATLSGLGLSPGTISPSFDSSIASYTASVTNATSYITISPTVTDTTATVKVNGTVVAYGSKSAAIPLAVGTNTITTVVTAQDGTTTSYTITVTREYLVLQKASQGLGAWGFNGSGELGDNTTANRNLPVLVTQSGVLQGKTVVSVAAGGHHSLALCSDGTVVAWGYNAYGQLGNNSNAFSSTPVLVTRSGVLAGKTVVSVAAGYYHSLALCSDGTVAAWGYNSNGQLGNNSKSNSSVPMLVSQSGVIAGKSVVSIAAGHQHSLALCSDGTLATWGYNGFGQLGNNSTKDSSVPVLVSLSGVLAGKSVISIAAGGHNSLALCSDGTTVAAWGLNLYGQLGNNSTTNSSVPVVVTQNGVLAGKTVVSVAESEFHSLALCLDGTVAAWGLNSSGQLGNNSAINSKVPVLVVDTNGVLSGKTVVSVAAGGAHSLALCSDGTVASWGLNSNGQLGNNSTTNSSVPVVMADNNGVLTGQTVVSVAAGGAHSLALASVQNPSILSGLSLSSGTLSPSFDPATTDYSASVPYSDSSIILTPTAAANVPFISVNGVTVTSGLASQAIPLVVGPNDITIIVTAPDGLSRMTYKVTVTLPSPGFTSTSDALITTSGYTATGKTVALSLGFSPPTGTNLTIVNNTGQGFINGQFSNLTQGQLVDLAYGGKSYHFVANYYGGTGNDLVLQWAYQDLADWGSNSNGQLGNGSTSISHIPVLVTQTGVLTGKTVISIAAGFYHNLALCSDGTIAAWGKNGYGQLGNNSTTDSNVPVLVTQNGVLSGKTVVSVAAGNDHSLALCSDGTVVAWGYNSFGQLGNNSITNSSMPVLVTQSGVITGKKVVSVMAGGHHSLALCSDGTVAAWGYNNYGQLGNNSTIQSNVPVMVTQSGLLPGNTVVSLAAGDNHSLALYSDGSVAAWGNNGFGQLGNSSMSNSSVPVLVNQTGVLAGKPVVSIAAGGVHSLALYTDHTVAAWGSNGVGELGNGGTNNSPFPIPVTQSGALRDRTVIALAAGYFHSLALCSDGSVAAWGDNSGGELGNNSTMLNSLEPVVVVDTNSVLSSKIVVSVAGGYQRSLALASVQNPPDLVGLSLSAGTLSPTFAASTVSYTASVSNTTTSITMTPTIAAGTATIKVNGVAVTSGTASGAIPLAVGTNVITTAVIASDGIPSKTYTVTVTRSANVITSFASWISNFPSLTDSSPIGDPNHNGIPNLLEYVLNGNPGAASSAIPPRVSKDANNFIFTFRRLALSVQDTTQIFQYSSDMTVWEDVMITYPRDPKVALGVADANGIQTVTVTIPNGANARMFGRLKVTQP